MDGSRLFDYGYEGTTIKDCIEIQKKDKKSTIVVDSNGMYGTTYEGFEQLKKSIYVKNCVQNRPSELKTKQKILIEAFPTILRINDPAFENLKKTGMMEFAEFIKITSHFYISKNSKVYRIPYTKTDIVDSKIFDFKEKHLFNKFLKGLVSFTELSEGLGEKAKRTLTEGIMGGKTINKHALNNYLDCFGEVPFLYPKYGLKEISEVFARSNAMCGAAYLLDQSLVVTERNENNDVLFSYPKENNEKDISGDKIEIPKEYKFKIDSSHGPIFAKEFKKSALKEGTTYVRVLNLSKQLYAKTFFAYANNNGTMIKVIGLNSDTECCIKGTYLIYIIKTDRFVSDEDIEYLGIDRNTIKEDISYEVMYEYKFDEL